MKIFNIDLNFQDLVERIGPAFEFDSARNAPVPPETAVMACLRLLASGSFQNVTGQGVTMSQSSQSRKLKVFCEQVISTMEGEFLHWYRSPEELNRAKAEFYDQSGISGIREYN